MSGLIRKLSRGRSAGPEGSKPPAADEHGTTDATATPPAEAGGHISLLKDPAATPSPVIREDEPPTPSTGAAVPFVAPVAPVAPAPVAPPPSAEAVADLPAGIDPDELAAAPATSARRSKLRRRVAFLRAARELLLRDLGGFIYELHRTAHDIEHEAHRRLRETKLARLSRVDAELHELEYRLEDVRRQVLVREPGVGGECAHCGELFASSAHYCSNCGNPLTESARRQLAKAQEQPVAEASAPVVTAAADQPTQEIARHDPDHPAAEFQWPSRTPGAEGEDETPATPSGETPATEGETPSREAAGETSARSSEAATATDQTPAPNSDAAGADPAPSSEPVGAESETPATNSAAGAESQTPATTSGEAAATERGPSGDGAPTADDTPATRNGSMQDDTILHPVERRQ